MKSSGRLSSCGWNFANLKLNSPQIECYIYYTEQQNKGFRARLQSVGDEGEKKAGMMSCATVNDGTVV